MLTPLTGSLLDWDASLSFSGFHELHSKQKQLKRVRALGAATVPLWELPAVWALPSGLQSGIWLMSLRPASAQTSGANVRVSTVDGLYPTGHKKERTLLVSQASCWVPRPSTWRTKCMVEMGSGRWQQTRGVTGPWNPCFRVSGSQGSSKPPVLRALCTDKRTTVKKRVRKQSSILKVPKSKGTQQGRMAREHHGIPREPLIPHRLCLASTRLASLSSSRTPLGPCKHEHELTQTWTDLVKWLPTSI